ncbi:hypothetical protein HER39_13635 [Arthrobacter deserti]|uniref:Uncharacterized protein n=1 Tax=Arthrobacter deserti TaxID=1742687 RepID=A0ABX1JRG6_9MICC|nr:hypothetical protein [Arthrobacter deserti]
MAPQTGISRTEPVAPPGEAFSTLGVRVGQEPGRRDGSRARLFCGPAPGGQPLPWAASSPEAVLDRIRAWLEGLQQEAVPPGEAAR